MRFSCFPGQGMQHNATHTHTTMCVYFALYPLIEAGAGHNILGRLGQTHTRLSIGPAWAAHTISPQLQMA